MIDVRTSEPPIVAIVTGRNGCPISGRTNTNWKAQPTGIATRIVTGIAIHGFHSKVTVNSTAKYAPSIIRSPCAKLNTFVAL